MKYTVLLVSLTLVCALAYIYTQKRVSDEPVFIAEIEDLQDVIFIEDHILLTTSGGYYVLKLEDLELSSFKKLPPNSILGFEGSRFLLCTWDNRIITSPEQLATKIEINDLSENTIAVIKTSETVRPLKCSINEPVFIDNYPNSPLRTYSYLDEELVQMQMGQADLSGQVYRTDHYIKIFSNSENDLHILIDNNNGVWLLEGNSFLKKPQ